MTTVLEPWQEETKLSLSDMLKNSNFVNDLRNTLKETVDETYDRLQSSLGQGFSSYNEDFASNLNNSFTLFKSLDETLEKSSFNIANTRSLTGNLINILSQMGQNDFSGFTGRI